MDLHSLVSCGLDSKLRCFSCKNYLSYFPISLCSNTQSLCGRCAVPEGLFSLQNEAFETICQSLKFPCRFKPEGCLEELAPKDVPNHEQNCAFRTVLCIISKPQQCKWEGSLSNLSEHCHKDHSDAVLKNGEFRLDMSVSGENDFLVEQGDVLFMLSEKFDADSVTLHAAIYNHQYETNLAKLAACMTLSNANKMLMVDLRTSSFAAKALTKVLLHSIQGETGNKASGKILLAPRTVEVTKFYDGRVLRDVFFSCPLHDTVVCAWKGFKKDRLDHILNIHQVLFVKSNEELQVSEKDASVHFRLMRLFNNLFRLAYCVTDNGRFYMWSVQSITPLEDKVKYEVDVVDGGGSGRRLVMRQHCAEFTKREDIFKFCDLICYLGREQLRNFVDVEGRKGFVVKFKVHLCK